MFLSKTFISTLALAASSQAVLLSQQDVERCTDLQLAADLSLPLSVSLGTATFQRNCDCENCTNTAEAEAAAIEEATIAEDAAQEEPIVAEVADLNVIDEVQPRV